MMTTDSKFLDAPPAVDNHNDFDTLLARVLAGAADRINADRMRAQELGIIDEHGNRISKELPPDMQPGAQRDFGG